MDFHREERRKLPRRPGETDAELDAQLFARYAQVLAAIPDTQEIRDKNEFAFWKRVLRSVPSDMTSKPHASTYVPRDGVTGSNCGHEPRCTGRTADCIARTIAEARAERERKSG